MDKRFTEHIQGHGSAWTRLHTPLRIIECCISEDKFDEDQKTMTYMDRYGIDKVRGGIYSQIDLSNEQKQELIRKFRHENQVCINCGQQGHFIKDCTYKISENKEKCFKCGREGHFASNCYAKTKINGNQKKMNYKKFV